MAKYNSKYTTGASVDAALDKAVRAYPCVINEVVVTTPNKFNPNTATQKNYSGGTWVDDDTRILSDVVQCAWGDSLYFYKKNGDGLTPITASVFLIGTNGEIVYASGSSYKTYSVPSSHSSIGSLLGVRIIVKTTAVSWSNKSDIELTINEEQTSYSEWNSGEPTYVDKVNALTTRVTSLEGAIYSRWYGKNVLVFGDSISTDAYANYQKWATALSSQEGFNLFNYSVNGYGYLCGQTSVEQGEYNMIHQIETAKSALESASVIPDLIILFMGTNDSIKQVPIGERGDGMYITTYQADTYMTPKYTDTSVINTFYGAVEHCMARIKEVWNSSKVAVLLPLQRRNQWSSTSGMNLLDYANIIKSTADMMAYPVKDLYHEAGFAPTNIYDRENKTLQLQVGIYDGLHPNENFSKNVLAPMIGKFIENI